MPNNGGNICRWHNRAIRIKQIERLVHTLSRWCVGPCVGLARTIIYTHVYTCVKKSITHVRCIHVLMAGRSPIYGHIQCICTVLANPVTWACGVWIQCMLCVLANTSFRTHMIERWQCTAAVRAAIRVAICHLHRVNFESSERVRDIATSLISNESFA
jgi:hypothetical protein